MFSFNASWKNNINIYIKRATTGNLFKGLRSIKDECNFDVFSFAVEIWKVFLFSFLLKMIYINGMDWYTEYCIENIFMCTLKIAVNIENGKFNIKQIWYKSKLSYISILYVIYVL